MDTNSRLHKRMVHKRMLLFLSLDRKVFRQTFGCSRKTYNMAMRRKQALIVTNERYNKDMQIVHRCEEIATPVYPKPINGMFSQN